MPSSKNVARPRWMHWVAHPVVLGFAQAVGAYRGRAEILPRVIFRRFGALDRVIDRRFTGSSARLTRLKSSMARHSQRHRTVEYGAASRVMCRRRDLWRSRPWLQRQRIARNRRSLARPIRQWLRPVARGLTELGQDRCDRAGVHGSGSKPVTRMTRSASSPSAVACSPRSRSRRRSRRRRSSPIRCSLARHRRPRRDRSRRPRVASTAAAVARRYHSSSRRLNSCSMPTSAFNFAGPLARGAAVGDAAGSAACTSVPVVRSGVITK